MFLEQGLTKLVELVSDYFPFIDILKDYTIMIYLGVLYNIMAIMLTIAVDQLWFKKILDTQLDLDFGIYVVCCPLTVGS